MSLPTHELNLFVKRLRAEAIAEHCARLGTNRVVCFTCGNASKALQAAGLFVIAVGAGQNLQPGKWFTHTEIMQTFAAFDATSGHLPMPLMATIAERLAATYPEPAGDYIWAGSGETYVLAKLAWPHRAFVPVYDNSQPATTFDEQAPLNNLVNALAIASNVKRVYITDDNEDLPRELSHPKPGNHKAA